MAPAAGLRAEFRAWIERELPLATIPDDNVLDALLVGRGAAIFTHLVSNVVSARNAATLRAQLDLQHRSNPHVAAIDDEAEEAEKLEREANEVEAELEELRKRLSSLSEGDWSNGGRAGAEESALRAAIIREAIENIEEGTSLCADVCEFLQARFSESKVRKHEEPLAEDDALQAVKAVQELLEAAEEALHYDGGAQARDPEAVQERMAAVHTEIEFLCQSRPLEDVATAVQRIAEMERVAMVAVEGTDECREGGAAESTESAEEFEKRIFQQMQDRYLALFAESEAAGRGGEHVTLDTVTDKDSGLDVSDRLVREVQADADALHALDKTLSVLTKGNRERMTLALTEARKIDAALLKPLEGLKTAAKDAQAARLEEDLRALDKAQHEDLSTLACPSEESTVPMITDTHKLREAVARMQRAVENRELAAEVDVLSARVRRLQLTRAQVDEAAKLELLPLLDRATAAAKHAAERIVPAAAAEVRVAARVRAFVDARTRATSVSTGAGQGEV